MIQRALPRLVEFSRRRRALVTATAVLAGLFLLGVVKNPLILEGLIFVSPVFLVGLVVAVRLIANKSFRSQTPVLRSPHKALALIGWLAFAFASLVLAGLDSVFIVSALVMAIYVLIAVWESTDQSQLSMRQRSLRLTILWLFPAIALALWTVPRRHGWRRVGAIFAALAALRIELAAGFIWVLILILRAGGHTHLKDFLQSVAHILPLFALTGGILVFMAAFIQVVYHYGAKSGVSIARGPRPPAGSAATPLRAQAAKRWVGATICLASWLGIVVFNVVPWLIISFSAPKQSGWVTSATVLSALAIAFVSGSAVAAIVRDQIRNGSSWLPNDALPAIAAALLLAIALTFGSVFAGTLTGRAQPLAWGLSIGISIGLSVGLGQALGLAKRLVAMSSSVVAIGLCTMLVVWSIVEDERWTPFSALVGLATGLVAGELLLVPGLAAFARILPFVRRMLLPLIGFATGYLFILLSFAGVFFATYIWDHRSMQVPSGHPAQLWDFVFFSLNTIAPLGYSGVKPTNSFTEVMSGVELIAGIAWLVVIFGALLAWLGQDAGPALMSPATPNSATGGHRDP